MPTRYRDALRHALGPSVRTPEWTPALALEFMDQRGIAGAILSLSAPGVHFGDDGAAASLASTLNDEMANIATCHGQLGAFATLPLPDVDAACREAGRALDVLGLDGVGILTGYEGRYLGEPEYDPLLEELDQRAAVVLVHPAAHPSIAHIHLGVPNFMLEYPFDTTRAAVNMIFADVLDRFPNIRFILSHGGGTLPYLAWRVATIAMRQLSQPPVRERFLRDRYPNALTARHEVVTADLVKQLMKRFWYDVALTADDPQLAALTGLADADRILFGSDWPYAYEEVVADQQRSLNEYAGLTAAARTKIYQTNAGALFPRFARNS